MLKNYCSIDDIQNYLLVNVANEFVSQIETWIEAQEAYIDQETGRNFVADDSASARLYDGDGSQELFIDDCIEIESVSIDGNELDPTEYYTYPANGKPIIKLALDSDRFAKGRQNVSVVAKWGYSEEVPADIRMACAVLVAGIINDQSVRQEGEVQSMTMGRYQVTYRTKKEWNDFENVKTTLAKYQRMTI
jgi:hypothetical protein